MTTGENFAGDGSQEEQVAQFVNWENALRGSESGEEHDDGGIDAKITTDVPENDHEIKADGAQDETIDQDSEQSQEVLLETNEGRIKLNESFYNELGALRRVIESKEPDGGVYTDGPSSLYMIIGYLQIYLDRGVTASIHQPELTEDGHAIDSFHAKKYEDALADYQRLMSQNPELLQEAKNLGSEKVDIKAIEDRIKDAKTVSEVLAIQDEVARAERTVDLRDVYELRSINFERRIHEIAIEDHDRKMEELKQKLEEFESIIAKDNSAGPIEKLARRMTKNYRERVRTAREGAAHCRKEMVELDEDLSYDRACKYFDKEKEQ